MNYTIESLINQLGYSSDNLVESNDKYYDYYYRIKISPTDKKEESICNIIGIKVFNSVDEDEISKYHRIYWNKNDLPVSILVFKDEIRIYNNFVCDKEKALLYSSKNNAQTKFKLDYLSNDSILSNKFWEKLCGVIKNSERVDVKLLNNLEATINIINRTSNCNKNDAFDFITKCILTYAQRTYAEALQERPRRARKIVSENLGHHRTEVTRIYLADKPQKK